MWTLAPTEIALWSLLTIWRKWDLRSKGLIWKACICSSIHTSHTQAIKSIVWKHIFRAFATTVSLKDAVSSRTINLSVLSLWIYEMEIMPEKHTFAVRLYYFVLLGQWWIAEYSAFLLTIFFSHCRFDFRLYRVVLLQTNCFQWDFFLKSNHIYWFKNLPQWVAVIFININQTDNVPLVLSREKKIFVLKQSSIKPKSHHE